MWINTPIHEEKIKTLTHLITDLKKKYPWVRLDRGHKNKNTPLQLTHLLTVDKQEIHRLHIEQQKIQAQEAVANRKVGTTKHKFEHTKRHDARFNTNHPSSRYQLWFWVLDDIDIPFLLPVSDNTADEAETIRASVYDWEKVPHELIIAYLDNVSDALKSKIPTPYLQEYKVNTLRTLLMQEAGFMETFKAYLAAGKALYYLHATTSSPERPDGFKEQITPRVSILPDGKILVSQHDTHVYTEQHTKKLTWTKFFFKVYPNKAAYLHAEQHTIHQLTENPQRFSAFHNRLHTDLRAEDTPDWLLKQELKKAPLRFKSNMQEWWQIFSTHHTTADQVIALLCEKMLNSTHTWHIHTRRNEILSTISSRYTQAEKMSNIIEEQSPQV